LIGKNVDLAAAQNTSVSQVNAQSKSSGFGQPGESLQGRLQGRHQEHQGRQLRWPGNWQGQGCGRRRPSRDDGRHLAVRRPRQEQHGKPRHQRGAHQHPHCRQGLDHHRHRRLDHQPGHADERRRQCLAAGERQHQARRRPHDGNQIAEFWHLGLQLRQPLRHDGWHPCTTRATATAPPTP